MIPAELSTEIINISREGGNDLTALFTMRYRLAADPDVDASYSPVTTTRNILGVTTPYFDTQSVADGTYVVHTYANSGGPTTGTKATTVVVTEGEVPIDPAIPLCDEYYNNTGAPIYGVDYTDCADVVYSSQTIPPGASICVKSISGGDWAFLVNLGKC